MKLGYVTRNCLGEASRYWNSNLYLALELFSGDAIKGYEVAVKIYDASVYDESNLHLSNCGHLLDS